MGRTEAGETYGTVARMAREIPHLPAWELGNMVADAERIARRNHRHAERRCGEPGYDDGEPDDATTPAARCERSMARAIQKAGMIALEGDPRNAPRPPMTPDKVHAYLQGDPRGPGIVLAWMDVGGTVRTASL